MPLQHERPRAPIARLMPLPARAEVVDRTLSGVALVLLIASWAAVYAVVAPPDRPAGHRAQVAVLHAAARP